MSINPKHEWFKLKRNTIIFLFVYYVAILITTICVSVYEVLYFKSFLKFDLFSASLGISIIYSLLGSSIFYVRKLYKACINLDITSPVNEKDNLRQLGVIAYFFLRPIFAAVFSIIILILLRSGISILSTSETLTIQFYYLAIIISFFTGFSAGDVVDKFEAIGKEIVNKVSKLNI